MLESLGVGGADGIGGLSRTMKTGLSDALFARVHGNNLIYNMCWEDPRTDREAMSLDGSSRVVVITSGGCNAIDYLLDAPAEVLAVDMNPRQNALLALKVSALRTLAFEDLFRFFGDGWHPQAERVYRTAMRPELSETEQRFWDNRIEMFQSRGARKTFYYRGTCGAMAWAVMRHFRSLSGVGPALDTLLEATTLSEQQRIYLPIEERLWTGLVGRASRSDLFSSLLGVPESQRSLVEASHAGGFMGFIRESVKEVLAFRPIADNYFWRGYIRGQYSMGCCPEYLKPEQAERLRTLTDRLSIRTGTVTSVMQEQPESSVSHFVMLDHQDWMAAHAQEALATEWSEILRSGRSGGSVLLRSANRGRGHLPKSVGSSVAWDDALANRLHTLDRVGSYASFHVGRMSK